MPAPKNLIHETTTGTGTGNLTLAAVNGKIRFSNATHGFDSGVTQNVFDYFISSRDAAEWERGTGHMSDADTLVRDTVVQSSNSNNAVDFTAGTKDVTSDIPAANQARLDAANAFTGANTYSAQQTFTLAGNTAIFRNTSDSASVQVARFEGDRATMADSDEAYVSYLLSNDGGTQTEFARFGWVAVDVNAATNVDGSAFWSLVIAGSITKKLVLNGSLIAPATDGGLALGSTSLAWDGLHLNTGTAINWEGGDVTLTHSSNTLAFAGASSGYTFDAHVSTTGKLSTTQAAADALAVGNATNPSLQVDTSTGSAATGLKIVGKAAGSGVALSAISSGSDENLDLDGKGASGVRLGLTSTGDIRMGRNVQFDVSVSGTGVATQTNMESASATNLIVTPGRQQYHPGTCKGWVVAGVSANIIVSHNVSSVTDDATGVVGVNWNTDFSSANYICLGTSHGVALYTYTATRAAGSIQVGARNADGNLTDPTEYSVGAWGDQ